jgi:type I restriction enzyme, S subunit
VRCISEIADCLDNLRVPLNDSQRTKMEGDYPYCGANGVLDYIDRYCVEDAVILIAEDGGYFDEYMTRPIAYRMSGRFWVNNHAHILQSKPEFDQDFLFYSLVHKNILSFLASGTRAKLNKSELNKITIDQPSARAEQTAIATLLSDMDADIAALEAKLGKARGVKQGMMQELLTGRIRLV